MVRRKIPGQETLRIREKNGIPFLTAPLLSELGGTFLHGFSTRLGGVSERPDLASMNLSFLRGDDPEKVRENYRRIGAALGFEPADLVFTHQTHTRNVRVATEEDRGKGYARDRDYTDVDGLVTNVPGLVLTVFCADCVPILLADPVRRAIGVCHSGWRGTVGDIAGATVGKMKEAYGSDPADLWAVIGPSICQDCYEVSEDVIQEVRLGYPEELWPTLFTAKGGGKFQLDLWEACRQNLLGAGLLAGRIQVTDLCTCCNPAFLFSHRASKGKRGLLAGFLSIKKNPALQDSPAAMPF